ncbi:hypothetical protein P9112_013857 [Eukaryota sp. TZLM1-RC]
MQQSDLVTAYRFLSRNLKPPQHVLEKLKDLSQNPVRPLCPGGMATPVEEFPNEKTFGIHNIQFTSLDELSRNKFDRSRLVLPDTNTSKNNLNHIAEIREARIVNRLVARQQELASLPAAPIHLQNERHAIELIPLQRRLRVRAAELLTRVSRVSTPVLPALSRTPLYTPSEGLTEEKTAFIRRKQQRKSFLDSVVEQQKRHFSFHQAKSKTRQRISKSVLHWLAAKDKREAMQKEREQRERLRLLKANDVEAYMNLVQEHKKDRLMTLLQQTETYLQSIGAMIEKETEEKEVDVEDLDKVEDQFKVKKKAYYSIAHKVTEQVEQPQSLVFGTLKGYQLEGLKWLVSLYNNRLNGILADEMGLGKTIQTIALITYLYEKKNLTGQFLIIVPLSTVANWQLEFSRWAPTIDVVRFTGNKDSRKALYKERLEPLKFQVCITTFDFIIKDKKYLSKVSWAYIVVDEGHRMKNSAGKLTTTLRKDYHSRNRVLLTGTPLQNSLPELWSLLNWLLPNIFSDVGSFQNWFAAPFDDKKDQELEEEEELLIIQRLHQVLQPFLLRRLKSDVEDQLPGKKEVIVKVPLSAWQDVFYQRIQLTKTATMTSATGKATVKGMQNAIMQLRKVCNHPWVFLDEYDISEDLIRSSGKFVFLDRMLPKLRVTGHKVLIFTQMVQIMDLLGQFLSYRGYHYLRLDGGTKADERGELLREFNRPDSPYFVFLLSTRAGGLGLNLQSADTVVIFDSDWNPQADLQAQDRAHRLGQQNEVRVLRLCTTTPIEENIISKAHHKLDIDSKIIQAGLYNPNATNEERKAALEELIHRPSSAMTDVTLGSNIKVINKQLARSEEEEVLFNRMDDEYDEERAARYKTPNPPPPLMTHEELPQWVVEPPKVEEEEDLSSYGRGARRRAEVSYVVDPESDDEYLRNALEEYFSEGGEESASDDSRAVTPISIKRRAEDEGFEKRPRID